MKKLSHQIYYGDRHLSFKELNDFKIEREIEFRSQKKSDYKYQELKTPKGHAFQKITFFCPYLFPPKKAVTERAIGLLVDGTVSYVYSHGKLACFILAAYMVKVEGVRPKDAANYFHVPYYWRLFLKSYQA